MLIKLLCNVKRPGVYLDAGVITVDEQVGLELIAEGLAVEIYEKHAVLEPNLDAGGEAGDGGEGEKVESDELEPYLDAGDETDAGEGIEAESEVDAPVEPVAEENKPVAKGGKGKKGKGGGK